MGAPAAKGAPALSATPHAVRGSRCGQLAGITAQVKGKARIPTRLTAGRWDAPPVLRRERASAAEAIRAGDPHQRQLALQELDEDVMAATSKAPVRSRLATWSRLCAAWEVADFPLSASNVKAVAASLQRGQYTAVVLSTSQRRLCGKCATFIWSLT